MFSKKNFHKNGPITRISSIKDLTDSVTKIRSVMVFKQKSVSMLISIGGISIAVLAVVFVAIFPTILRLCRVGSAFTAKTVCAGYFVSGRPVEDILSYELNGLASSIFRFHVDAKTKTVIGYPLSKVFYDGIPTSSFSTYATAYYLGPELGCQVVHPNDQHQPVHPSPAVKLSARTNTQLERNIDLELQAFLDSQVTEESFKRNQTRATVVISGGYVVGESYQSLIGISNSTKLLGWSMTKSVQSIMLGAMIQQKVGGLTLEEKVQLLQKREGDGRPIRIFDLLSMADVNSEFPEYYDFFSSVPHMLYLSHSHGDFALNYSSSSKRKADHIQVTNRIPLMDGSDHQIDPKFSSLDSGYEWYYSSGVSNILASVIRSYFDNDEEYWKFPFESIFDKLGAAFTCGKESNYIF